ncbi:DUF4233 domain-containing protein [Propionibacteriaceae bacterium Y1923]|uniref:DUF4233 domain-containing protein n=1 Tax=Aestuariimicrobium sp. Y1814 TaxID=3418742 RepID=UPI003C155D0F
MILRSDNPMMRALVMTLWFEVIVFWLALPGMLLVDHRDTTLSIAVVTAGSVLAIAAARGAKKGWGQWLGWLVQVAALAMGFMTSMMFAVGVVFALIWVMCIVLGRRLETQAPGQSH